VYRDQIVGADEHVERLGFNLIGRVVVVGGIEDDKVVVACSLA
jgi:hypothetical protein